MRGGPPGGHRRRRRPRGLQARIFFGFGASILVTGVTTSLVAGWLGERGRWSEDVARVEALVARRFERVWDAPAERSRLADDLRETLDAEVVVRDRTGRRLDGAEGSCDGPAFDAAVPGRGAVEVCLHRGGAGLPFLPVLLVALLTLWAMSGGIARRLSRPLAALVTTTRRIGEGDLRARAAIGHRAPPEVRELADAVHEMADRIARQLAEQRELLAAVSHEIRTPLGHLRILVDLLRERGADPATVDELEGELLEADGLVDALLASSRLEVGLVDRRPLDAAALARRALERAGLPAPLVDVDLADLSLEGDATLLGRALANLLRNAAQHGGGLVRLGVRGDDARVRFEVDDAGPGFPAGERARLFAPFARGQAGTAGLGLGLALVARIAAAHGGQVRAEERPGGGARVVIEVARRAGAPGPRDAVTPS